MEPKNIVISGISGRYPNCNNVEEFKTALLENIDLISEGDNRFPTEFYGVSKYMGKIADIDKFDASFFGLLPKQAKIMDPRHRILLEKVFECLYDAGFNPEELKGSKTGVYLAMSSLHHDPDDYCFKDTEGYVNLGFSTALGANRASYCFDFKGPSYSLDSACSSSLNVLTNAVNDIRSGITDSAVVCAAQLALNPLEMKDFEKLHLLSPSRCKVFAKHRDGYTRAESVVSFFLQKRENARRIYAEVVGVKSVSDGFKKEEIASPSHTRQSEMIRDLYASSNISPQDISYLELHGTGTKVGDFQELRAVQSYFGNKPRNKPLFVGSLKSNMGHSELACGLCSLTKVIIAMESGIIPANLYAEPLDMELPGIKEKTVQVVTKNTKYDGGLIGVNSFGMGGTDAHVVLKPNTHKKTYDCNNLKHRLVQISGRTEKAVVDSLSEIQRNENDVEFLALIDEIHKSNVQQHDFRGYIVLGSQPVQEVVRFKGQRPIWFIYSGIGSQWTKMGKDLMNIPVFKNSIEQCVKALEPYNVDLINIITNENYQYTSRVALSCAIIAVEIGLTDVLNSIGIVPDGIVGHSLGEVGAAYADGTMTLEQAILVAYARGFSLDSVNLIPGQMAAVGLSKEQILPMLPEDICVACHNSSTNITISGPKESVKSFVEELTAQNIFAKLVNSLDVPYHSKYIQDSLPVLFDFCKKVLDNPKPRSNKWISSSVGENDKNQEWSQFNCAEYHCNNVRNPVLFDEIFKYIPKNALVVEIAPHGLLQSILKRELDPNVCNVSIANRFSEDNQQFFLSAIGKIYTAGGQPNLRKLYNDVTFPVSCNTKMLSPLVQWDHKLSWFVPLWKLTESFGDVVRINLSDKRYAHYQDQQIDGRHIMPVMGYMEVLWEVFAKLKLQNLEKVPVVIENITFHRVVILSYEEDVVFLVNIMKQSGNFEISESGTLVCSGTIRGPTDMSSEFLLEQSELPDASKNINYTMKREDIYKDLLLRRLEYNTMFKSLLSCNLQGCNGTIEWNGNFCSFLDGMLHVKLIASSRDLLLPTSIKQIIIDPISHMHLAEKNKEMPIMYRPDLNIIKSGQIEIIGVDYIKAYSNQHQQKPNLETYEFVYYDQEENVYSFKDSLQITLEIVLQNNLGLTKKLEICEIKNDSHSERFSDKIKNILDLQPQSDVQYVMEDSEHLQQQYDLLVYSKNKKFDTTKLTENGFILYIGKEHVVQSDCLQIVYRATTTENNIYLLKPKFEIPEKHAVINVSNSNFDWLQNIQKLLLKKDTEVIYLVSNEENSGIVGLINCLLTEPSEIKFRSILTDKKARPFSIRDGLYKQQLEKNLTINVLKNDVWGTFVHLPVQDLQTKEVPNASVTVLKQGDISSLCWIERETPVKRNSDVDNIVNIYYSAVNAEDVLVAKGSPQLEDNENAPTATDVYMGHEYSGITLGGKRVMGLLRNGAMSMQIQTDSIYSWDVPESWSLEDAATVPYTYLMCLHAMIIKGKIQASDSILIFNGRSAVEIAAINIAMSMKCNIFVCAKTNEDKEFIKNKYPGLSGDQIGNIQNSDFASNISKRTNGKGVDLVLNAFNLNVFQSCIRCIAQNGRFLEIGTSHVDISEAAKTKMSLKNNTYHETCLEDIINCPVQLKQEIHSIFFKCLKDKVVKPLPRVLFNKFDLESAFNYLTPEIQTKVIIQLNEETNINSLSLTNKILALPRIYFHPEKSYILVGGLGGFGLEVTNWMIKKGARKFVLNSRNGIQNGYQAYCLEKWSQFKDVVVKINNDDTSTISGAEKLVKCAQSLGSVGGVFNMAAVLRDAPIFDQVKENFEQVFLPKLVSSQNMDTVTRRLCTGLDHFIMFSSVTSGKGNAGQTNYGMANSALERLCETRRQGKLPGLVIQWGPPAEIGVLVDEENSENVIPNVQHEKLNSCLKTLEYFMLQSYTIGSSLVVDKTDTTSITTATSAVELVARLLDIKNLDQVDKSKTLSQFGLDSLLATEIKQTLFRTHKLNFSINEVRDITLYSLEQLEES